MPNNSDIRKYYDRFNNLRRIIAKPRQEKNEGTCPKTSPRHSIGLFSIFLNKLSNFNPFILEVK